ncbi:amidohydrolase family protein [Actinoplanes couchii]|uniref:Amidohydrolase n=1 Tax=Actinoplanes couchii TaxID=403638 RepID=A0ABQ3X537_9ACTN|nr:amidohydrolase [Actinoplanes couchii]MDR6326009.1 hypothetical protein [Actinoplanes couchii]GID53638.1 hypothetical protein Aco03nite_020420 [Actinoplanes couchii]
MSAEQSDVCETGTEPSAAACCGSGAGAGCGLSALRRSSGPRPTVTRADETPSPAARGRVEWLAADAVWWGGRLRKGVALRVAPDGTARPVPAEMAPAADGTRRLPGTLLPGLVDAHVHSALVDLGTVRAGGIAEVWDLGGVPAEVAALAERGGQEGTGLPRIRYAGPFLIAPGGYPSDRSWAAPGSWREIRTAEDAGAAVTDLRTAGASLIKVTAHTGGPQLAPSVLTALVSAAHTAGLPVVVHAEGSGTVEAALSAGADILAHTPWTERIDDALLRACASAMRWISTLDIHGWGDPDPAREVAVDNLRRFVGYGGVVRYGTDLGNGPLPPGINVREIGLLGSAGLTPDEVLTAMTEKDSTTVSWIPEGLDLTPERFADTLATARVLDAEACP